MNNNDLSLDFSHNQKIGKYQYKDRQLSPHSRMLLQSESQFMKDDNRRDSHRDNLNEDNTIWDKLSRIFTFGCIETNHNDSGKSK